MAMDYEPMVPEKNSGFWESLKPKEAKEFFNYFIGAIVTETRKSRITGRDRPDTNRRPKTGEHHKP